MHMNGRYVRQKTDEALCPPQTSELSGGFAPRFENGTDLSDVRDKTRKQLEGLMLRSETPASPSHTSQSVVESYNVKAPNSRGGVDAHKSSGQNVKPRVTYTKRCEVESCTKGAKRSTTGCCRFCKAHMKAAGLVPLETHLHCAQQGCTRFAKASSEGVWRYCKAHMQLHGMWPRDYNPDRRPRTLASATQPASPNSTSTSSEPVAGIQDSKSLVQSLRTLLQMQKTAPAQGAQQQQQQAFYFNSLPMTSSNLTGGNTSALRNPQHFLRGLDLATGTISAGSPSFLDAATAPLQISALNVKANSEPIQFLKMQGGLLQHTPAPTTESISEPLPRLILNTTVTRPKYEGVMQQIAAAAASNPALQHLKGSSAASSDFSQILHSMLSPAPQHEAASYPPNPYGNPNNAGCGTINDAARLSSAGAAVQPATLLQPGISLQTLQNSGLSASTIVALLQQQQQQQQQEMALVNLVRPGSGPVCQQQQQQQQQEMALVNLVRPGSGPVCQQQQQELASVSLFQPCLSPLPQLQQQLKQDIALSSLLKTHPGLGQQQQYGGLTNLILQSSGTLSILPLMSVQGAGTMISTTAAATLQPTVQAVPVSLFESNGLQLQDLEAGHGTSHNAPYALVGTGMDVDATSVQSNPAMHLSSILEIMQQQQRQ
ncbi:hypothetical protein CEUSTIGMA_g3704.t1 [Chlamydomonas eustigma]|uniref:Uncharacterized protein n=1 Tax=Chlamydomonas eustigma TaxID=1157962 RepID=A0A250X0H5_9CHLO|nr:hypothetical protein CEUSTIGMA_g3704.t1 [Chlamydomonas eustigma]|eukprot:GAX76260.1 hypothetical protein CEUSTIGMA_g3704.t1 [Chlamydomonas eustigma]